MADTETTPEQTTTEDLAKAREVAGAAGDAGAKAIEQGASKEDTRRAIDEAVDAKIKSLSITMSDADKDDMVHRMIDQLDAMGAFQPAPAPEPTEPAAAAPTPEAAAEAAAAQAQGQPEPRKRSFAERFAGI